MGFFPAESHPDKPEFDDDFPANSWPPSPAGQADPSYLQHLYATTANPNDNLTFLGVALT
jgi:hypothetical protein